MKNYEKGSVVTKIIIIVLTLVVLVLGGIYYLNLRYSSNPLGVMQDGMNLYSDDTRSSVFDNALKLNFSGVSTRGVRFKKEHGNYSGACDEKDVMGLVISLAKVPKIQTVVTGIANDIFMSDSLIIIGLDYYLGPNGKYRPMNVPGYLLKRYQKEYLVPQIMLMYSNYFNKTDYEDQTALADMVYYGKAYHMAKNLMPCAPDSILTGYTAFETNDIDEHEPVIWASFLENEVLYERNPFIKDKFLSERPQTLEVGSNCPGRIGRWIGWNIVRKYASEHENVSLPDLMQMDDAQKIFSESKYKPIPY